MKKLLFPVFLFLIAGKLPAQILSEGTGYQEIYRLSDRQARAIVVDGVAFDTSWLHSPLGISDTLKTDRLPPGYYLTLAASAEHILASIFIRHAFEVSMLPVRRGLALVVTNRSGARISDAQVTIDGKKVRFDKKMLYYRRAGRRQGGTLEVKVLGSTFFYEIKPEASGRRYHPRWQRFMLTPVGRAVNIPRTVALQLWHSAHQPSLFRNYWHQWVIRRENRLEAKEAWNGYVAFSQPKYRPGDTLKVKAWITDWKYRPWKKPVELTLSRGYYSSKKLIRTLSPVAPGVFTWETVLTDSLEIDQNYIARFENPKPKDRGLFNSYEPEPGHVEGGFYFEDYQLDEIRYTFTKDKDAYTADDSIVFHLKARDATGQPVADGSYKLVVTTTGLTDFYNRELFVPDTLWFAAGTLAATGEMDIRIPDHLLPNASYSIEAALYATTSSGELQQKKLYFQVDRSSPRLTASLEKGWLLVSQKGNGNPAKKVLLQQYYSSGEIRQDTIGLPYRTRIQPEVNSYVVLNGSEMLSVSPNDGAFGGHRVSAVVLRSGDSVACVLQNPHRIPVQYTLWRDKKEWQKGIVADSLWVGLFSDPDRHDIHARLAFVWAGGQSEFSASAQSFKNRLNVQVKQPGEVMPGEHVQVKISVKDDSGKPAAGVDLTAGAYNGLFKDRKPYNTPNIKYKRKPYPLLFKLFEIKVLSGNTYKVPLSEKWYARLHLDTLPYYRLRNVGPLSESKRPAAFAVVRNIRSNVPRIPGDDQGTPLMPDLPEQGDSFYFNRPQFVPYVVKNHRAQPVYMIWANKKLVYYHDNTDNQPYSFYGQYGYNEIRIRTRNAEYTLDSVLLEAGKKVILSVAAEGWSDQPVRCGAQEPALLHTRVKWQARPDSLTALERSYLKKSMMLLRESSDKGLRILWDDVATIHIVPHKNQVQVLGPFTPKGHINALFPGRFLTRFRFDPEYEYDVQFHRERLYVSDWLKHKRYFPAKLPVPSPNQWALAPFHIQRLLQRYKFQLPKPERSGTGSLFIKVDYWNTHLKGMVLRRDTTIGMYAPGTVRWGGLEPGSYTLALYTYQNTVCEAGFEIRRDTVSCLDFSGREFRALKPTESFDALFMNQQSDHLPTPAGLGIYYQKSGVEGDMVIQGRVTDEEGEPLIGASVKLMLGGEMVAGRVTDMDGNYRFEVVSGWYEIEISYTGYSSQHTDVAIRSGETAIANIALGNARNLNEVVVTTYSVGDIVQDATSVGRVLTSDNIMNLPTRSVNAMMGTTAGVAIMDGGNINIKGARNAGTNYYIDGIRVSGIPPLLDIEEFAGAGLRSAFRDHAYWQPRLSTDAQGEAVFQATFPDDLTTWEAYAVAADAKGRGGLGTAQTRSFKPLTAQLAVPRFAVAGDVFDVSGRLVNHRDDSVTVSTRFLLNNKTLSQNVQRILQGAAEYVRVEIPVETDTALVNYELVSGALNDGEQRKIPVLPVGTLETEGAFWALESDTSFTLNFSEKPCPVTIHAEKDVIDVLLDDIEFLRTYPYGCNEQTAGRLIALLSLKKIKTIQGQPFLYEKDILACLKKLKNSQLSSGAWGWWANGTHNNWMTWYVAKALLSAQNMGYTVTQLHAALTVLRLQLPAMNPSDQTNTLMLLREAKVNVDCKPYLTYFETARILTLTDRLNVLKINQLCGNEVSKDSLLKLLHPTTFGGLYAGEINTGWYDRRTIQTLEAYRIAKTAGWTDITRRIERYWLHSRDKRRNTIETAQILEVVLPGLLNKSGALQAPVLRINGRETEGFPYTLRLDASNSASVNISKTGSAPVYLTAYQQWHEPAPAARSDLFEVTTELLPANNKPAQVLRYGEPVTLKVQVQVKALADYVMIEVPIPAACSYGEKKQHGYREVHREYFKDRTAIFCEQLPVGNYVFEIALEPRFTGRFTLNPVRVEQMYFPVFYGRNEVKRVDVEK